MNERRRHLVYDVVRRQSRGESERGISRALGIARETVRRMLREQAKRRTDGESAIDRARPAPRTPRPSKLDPYAERIEAWLEQYPKLTAVRLAEKLTAQGFDGGYTIVREHLKALRGRRTKKKAVQIVETPPGYHYGPTDAMHRRAQARAPTAAKRKRRAIPARPTGDHNSVE